MTTALNILEYAMSTLEISLSFYSCSMVKAGAILHLQFLKISLQVVNANTFSMMLEVH